MSVAVQPFEGFALAPKVGQENPPAGVGLESFFNVRAIPRRAVAVFSLSVGSMRRPTGDHHRAQRQVLVVWLVRAVDGDAARRRRQTSQPSPVFASLAPLVIEDRDGFLDRVEILLSLVRYFACSGARRTNSTTG
jgi:hypothetical protein